MAGKKKDPGTRAQPEGQLRQSQLVTTFGPGAMVDLVNRAVVIGGLEHWGFSRDGFVALDDERLRRSLIPKLKSLDPDLDLAREGFFRMPPEGDPRDPYPSIGVRALEFPRWFVCQSCRRLARAQEAFENKGGRYRHQCSTGKSSRAVPVRFVAACRRGHLGDFPWIHFAHLDREDGECERPELYLDEPSVGDISQIRVRCTNCGASQPLSHAKAPRYPCPGDRPWLGGKAAREPCQLFSELLVRTASDAYFGQIVSGLRLPPPEPDPLLQRLQEREVWKAVQKVSSVAQLEVLAELQEVVGSAIAGFDRAKVVATIQAERDGSGDEAARPLRTAEFERLVSAPPELPGVLPDPGAIFAAYRVPKQRVKLPKGIGGLVVVPELREVRVQVSFSRFDSVSSNLQGEFEFEGREVKPTVLTLPTGNEKWLPAAEIRGEGIFIELDPVSLAAWEARPEVQARAKGLQRGLEGDQRGGDFLGVRFYLLHSLSHLLLTAISLECGYSASAIRERIYCSKDPAEVPQMAAILLSTGTTGSEGTLGGLVEEGRRIEHHLRKAWELGRLCSNDPVCAAHDPASESSDRHAEGAACHGCLYVAECSCERFNRYLDRALVVPTIGNPPALAYFGERP
ncbi:MAG: DUF1998 domain-containing protein [Polyangiaceae bacterium]|nr:DUF1998 domain-containing protein [Polyangiaceae bacterium]